MTTRADLHDLINRLPEDKLEQAMRIIETFPDKSGLTWGELLRRFDIVVPNGSRMVTIGERERLLEALR